MAEITEIMPEEFTDKAIKEALEEKKILDAVESGDKNALNNIIKEIMKEDIEGDTIKENGGEGSGNFNHAGRPGLRGGSASSGFNSEILQEETESDKIKQKIASVKIDFTKDNILPELNKEDSDEIGIKSFPIRLKKEIIDRNHNRHSDLSDEESEYIIKQALYNPEVIIPGKGENYYHFIAKQEGKNSPLVLLDAEEKDGFLDIVHYFKVRERSRKALEKEKR